MAKIQVQKYIRKLEPDEVKNFIFLAKEYNIRCHSLIGSSTGVSTPDSEYGYPGFAALLVDNPHYATDLGLEFCDAIQKEVSNQTRRNEMMELIAEHQAGEPEAFDKLKAGYADLIRPYLINAELTLAASEALFNHYKEELMLFLSPGDF